MKNPTWTRDELILALDLYFRAGRQQLSEHHSEVIALSNALQELPIHTKEARDINFRSTQSVSMKLANFLGIDPTQSGAGLPRGGHGDQLVWDEFSQDPYTLHQIATTIIKNSQQLKKTNSAYVLLDETDAEEFPEGKLLTHLHKHKERNKTLIKRKKARTLHLFGRLTCEVCGFDFAEVYGDLGKEFVECHHKVPISQLDERHRTRLDDLALVCANCHRMLHRGRPLKTIDELRSIVERNNQTLPGA